MVEGEGPYRNPAQVAAIYFIDATDPAMRMIVDFLVLGETAGDDFINTVGVLGAMLEAAGTIPAVVLRDHGVDFKAIRSLEKDRNTEHDVLASVLAMTCRKEARWLGHNYIGAEHLLLGICCIRESRGSCGLAEIGIHPVQLCNAILEILGHGADWTEWLKLHPELTT